MGEQEEYSYLQREEVFLSSVSLETPLRTFLKILLNSPIPVALSYVCPSFFRLLLLGDSHVCSIQAGI